MSPLLTTQSMAFFRAPGTPWAYSGLEIRTPSEASSWERKSMTVGGAVPASRSSRSGLKCGRLASPSYRTTSTPSGARLTAALRRAVFEEAARRLPEIARIRTDRSPPSAPAPGTSASVPAASSSRPLLPTSRARSLILGTPIGAPGEPCTMVITVRQTLLRRIAVPVDGEGEHGAVRLRRLYPNLHHEAAQRGALSEQGVQAVAILRGKLVHGVRVKDARYRVFGYGVQDAGQQGEGVAGHDERRRLLRDLQGVP